jgi:hypothetical protein
MKAVVAVFRPPVGEGREGRAVGTDAEWLAMKPVQEPVTANRHIRFDVMTLIWSGATVGCIGAAVLPPFSEADDEGIRPDERMRAE